MKSFYKIIVYSVILLFAISCSDKKDEHTEMHNHDHEMKSAESELVRTGEIDIVSIDVNEDGKIYECPMDWNVLDDKAGDCPVCGMKLMEYSIEDIQKNLTKYGYKYKK